MKITRDEAICIVDMAEICYSEGQGQYDWPALLSRIREEFPDVEIPSYLPVPKPRVITRVISDGISTKDGLS